MSAKLSDGVLECFHDSFDRCKRDGRFFDLFYERFLASSPEVRATFDGVDLAKVKKMARDAIYLILMESSGSDFSTRRLSEFGDLHRNVGVKQHLYHTWLDSLLSVVEEVDPDYSVQVDESWRAVMGVGIKVMLARYAV
jgi:hemoglobin-like flavoprotein